MTSIPFDRSPSMTDKASSFLQRCAIRCDAMRCDTMRCDATRDPSNEKQNKTQENMQQNKRKGEKKRKRIYHMILYACVYDLYIYTSSNKKIRKHMEQTNFLSEGKHGQTNEYMHVVR